LQFIPVKACTAILLFHTNFPKNKSQQGGPQGTLAQFYFNKAVDKYGHKGKLCRACSPKLMLTPSFLDVDTAA